MKKLGCRWPARAATASTGRSVSRWSLRASAIRRSVIQRWTLRPVLRRTTVVGWPGVSPTSAATGLARVARRSRTLQDNWDARIPTLMGDAGFSDRAETGHLTKHIGRLTYYRATRAE